MTEQHQDTLQRLNQETAKIDWQELQRHYAGGNMVELDSALDLVNTGAEIVQDNKTLIESLIKEEKIRPVDDHRAKEWLAENQTLWALVIKPWVLVQLPKHI